jgi:hypothetical protein
LSNKINSGFPHFNINKRSEEELSIEYSSLRRLRYLAKGGCAKYFNERLYVMMKPTGSVAKFTISRTV